jgi:hypothetical protein
MPVPEFSESFDHEGRKFEAIFTEYDEAAQGFEPGRLTRVIRILVEDKYTEKLDEGDVITRLTTGRSYMLKPKKMFGIDLVEIDLHPFDGRNIERTF